MMQHVYIPKRKRAGYGRMSKPSYRGRYRLPWMTEMADVPLRCTDKRVAVEKLRAIVIEAEREHQGLIAPRAFRESAVKSLTEHVAEYADDLTALHRAKMHVYIVKKRLTKLFQETKWALIGDITADGFSAWRARQKLSVKTLNEYLMCCRSFIVWMNQHGRMTVNPLSGIKAGEKRGNERRKRRALSDDEAMRLRGVAGERWLCYMFALLTGLRRAEIRALRWDDIRLDVPKPFVKVRASTSKNHKDATLFLRDDLVEGLKKHRGNALPMMPVFKVPSIDRFKADIDAAGIPYKDAAGRQADFHALRVTYCTNLARGGTIPAVAKELMRHSDVALTMRHYTDTRLLPISEALDRLPRYDDSAITDHEQMRKTGTYDDVKIASQNASQSGFCSVRGESSSGTENKQSANAQLDENNGDMHNPAQVGSVGHNEPENWGTRIRT